jgi:hypothetical protein
MMGTVNITRSANDDSFVVFSHQEGSSVFVFDRWTSLGDMMDTIDREVKKQREEQEKRYAGLGMLKQGYTEKMPQDVYREPVPTIVGSSTLGNTRTLDDEIPF